MAKTFQYTFEFDYDDMAIEIVFLQQQNYDSEKEAIIDADKIEAQCILFPGYIHFFMDKTEYRLIDKNCSNSMVRFTIKILNDSAKTRIGKPLSLKEIESLKKQDKLINTVFSNQYMISPQDFESIDWPVAKVYQYLSRNHRNKKGFSFEYSGFSIKEGGIK